MLMLYIWTVLSCPRGKLMPNSLASSEDCEMLYLNTQADWVQTIMMIAETLAQDREPALAGAFALIVHFQRTA